MDPVAGQQSHDLTACDGSAIKNKPKAQRMAKMYTQCGQ